MDILDLLFFGPENLVYSPLPALAVGAIAGAAGGIVKGIGSLFGRRRIRREMSNERFKYVTKFSMK